MTDAAAHSQPLIPSEIAASQHVVGGRDSLDLVTQRIRLHRHPNFDAQLYTLISIVVAMCCVLPYLVCHFGLCVETIFFFSYLGKYSLTEGKVFNTSVKR